MRIARLLLFALTSASVVFTRPAYAQGGSDTTSRLPAYRLRLLGVYDDRTGEPVEGVDVIDIGTGVSAKTTSTGTVALAYMAEGVGFVRLRKLGYELQTMLVSISPADTVPITVILKKATELAAMTVVDSAPVYHSPGLRAFEERRLHASAGFFIPESTVRKEDTRRLSEFLRAHVASIQIRDGRSGTAYVVRSPRCGAGSNPLVYLDGVVLGSTTNPPNLSEISLTDIAAVEYYANTATAPSEFNRTSTGCGALLLWSREK